MAHRRGLLLLNASLLSLIFVIAAGLLGITAQAKGDSLPLSLPVAVCTPDTSDLVAYWPMDDGNGATTFVEVINGYDGSCTGDTCPVEDASPKINGAFYFDGSDEVTVPEFPGLDWAATDSFSLETWVKLPDGALCDGNKVFLGRHGNNPSVWLGCSETETAQFNVRDSNFNLFEAIGTTLINDGNWHYVVGVRDGTADTNKLYVDGVLEATMTTAYTGDFASSHPFSIGVFDVSPFYWLTGSLDELAVYYKALSSEEVSRHYFGGLGQTYCNDGPVFLSPASQVSAEGTSPNITIVAQDPDGEPVTLSAVGTFPPDLTFDDSTGQVNGSISYLAHTGTNYSITFTATETVATNISETMDFTWVVNDTNRPPQVTNPGTRTSSENDSINLPIVATDPDTDNTIQFDAEELPPGLSIHPTNGVISGVISNTAATGVPYPVIVTVTDDAPFGDHVASPTEITFNWNVIDENRPPEMNSIPNQFNAEGNAVNLPTGATDPDTDNTLTFSASNLPLGLQINPATGTITGTISYMAFPNSPYTVTVTVTDDAPEPLADSVTFTWTLTDVNVAPIVTDPGDLTHAVGETINLQIQADDPDGDPLTFTASQLPDGLSIHASTGVISGTLPDSSLGEHEVEITVSDGHGHDVLIEFVWNVVQTIERIYMPVVMKGGQP